jgi:DNA replication initiation complex subunit (GINS family)
MRSAGGLRMLSFEDVRRVQRMQRNSSSLVEMDDSFYDELAEYVNKKKEARDSTELRKLENVLKLARDVFYRREQIVAMNALRNVRTGEKDTKRMTFREKEMYDSLVENFRNYKQFYEGTLLGNAVEKKEEKETIKKDEEPKPKAPPSGEEDEEEVVLVRVMQPIPEFVGSNVKEYGPFKVNDVVKLPSKEAKILSEKNLVEVM